MRTRFNLVYRRRLICLVWLGIVVDILRVSWNFIAFNGTSPLSDESAFEEWRRKTGQQRVLCWISSPTNKNNRKVLIENTWGKRCDILLFKEAVGERETKEGWKNIYDRHKRDADWFLKTADDSYVVVEHLKRFLYPLDAYLPLHFGLADTYLLSRESLHHVVDHEKLCYNPECWNDELGIQSMDSKDAEGCHRFVPISLTLMEEVLNEDCSSSTAFMFPKVKDTHLQIYEFLIYHLNVVNLSDPHLPTQPLLTHYNEDF